MDATVVVVGGGATGTSVARDLAMRGADVALFDRRGLLDGTSGRSHGVLHSGARYLPGDPAGARDCLAENAVLRDIAPACVAETGGAFVSLAADDPAYFARKRAACEELDMAVDVRSGRAAREAVPALTDDVERLLSVPDAVVSPSRLVAATAASAREHGATVSPDTPVTDVHVADGAVTGVTAGGWRVAADHVVNAAGAWAADVAAMADASVPMAPTRGVMVVTPQPPSAVDRVVNRCRPPADGDIAVPRGDRLVLGTTSVPVDDPDEAVGGVGASPALDAEIRRVRRAGATMLPALDEAPTLATYAGVRPLYAGGESDAEGNPDAGGDERAISRDFVVLEDGHPTGLTTVAGGKLTTCRLMAEAVADRVCAHLGI
ncbi:MAG: FAD-dependent oxidoreductase, partial [Halobacteriaceae archaeon]